MSREIMVSVNLSPNLCGVIIDRIQVLPVTPLAIHLFSQKSSLIGKLNI